MARRRRPEQLWLGLVLIGTAFETWALRNKRQEATASALIRKTFCTHTRLGRIAFVLSWVALSTWLLPHIASKETNRVG